MIAGRKISLEEIYEVIQQIVDRFHPQSIILFGSYAYGQPEPWSDVDLLMIMDMPLKEIDQAVEICRSIRGEWIEKSEGDWRTSARELRARRHPNYDAVCFYLMRKCSDEEKPVDCSFR